MRFRGLVISLLLYFLPLCLQAEAGDYIFEHIQTSHHWINDIFQDSDGYMWVASRNGLYRHYGDGPNDYEIVQEGYMFYDITQDADGHIWVMRRDGLVMYDPATCVMTDADSVRELFGTDQWIGCFEIDAQNNFWWNLEGDVYVRTDKGHNLHAGHCEGHVQDICIKNNVVYVLTDVGMIYRYFFESDDTVRTLPLIPLTEEPVEQDRAFQSIFVDSNQNMWVSQGYYGVTFVKYGKEDIVVVKPDYDSTQRGFINSIVEDKDGNIWFSSDHGGITIWDKSCRMIARLTNDPSDDNTLASNGIYAMYSDHNGDIWVGYTKLGLSVYRGGDKVWSMSHLRSIHSKKLNDDINATCEDINGNIWFGTDGYGLVKYDYNTGKEILYDTQNSPLGSNVITDIHCDPKGRIWIGTFYGGLTCIDGDDMRTFRYEADDSGLASDNVWAIDHDEMGRIWIGTLGGGIQIINPDNFEMQTLTAADNRLSNDVVLDLECVDNGKVYVATAYGLSVVDSHTMSVSVYPQENVIQANLTGIMVDSRGLVWLDEDGILQVYDPVSGQIYTPEFHALDNVRGFIEGNDGLIWVVTDTGLCRIEVYISVESGYAFEISSFSFPQEDNLHFNQRSVSMTSSGDLIIGTFCGFMRFRQETFDKSSLPADLNLQFTQLYIGDQLIIPGQEYDGKVIIEYAIGYDERIVLPYGTSLFSIGFTNLDYFSLHDKPLYYRMEGLSDEWLPTDAYAGRMIFTNLSPRKYLLTLTPDKKDLSEAISLEIVIRPPWWASWTAVLLYILTFGVLTALVVVVVKRRRRQMKARMEQSIIQERRRYVDEMKMQFFTNVSHDFRTPLTLIMTPIEDLLAKHPEKKEDNFLMTIYRNAQKLLNLVNEVLDLRKLEMYGPHLNLTSADLVMTVRETVESFRLMAESQDIDLLMEFEPESLVFDFDSTKITKVLTNLLSNAFKFTPRGGTISVKVSLLGEDRVFISVKDTGCGIPDKAKRRIFDRFYQVKNSPAGSGIGLHIVNEFVILHGGEVSVSDNVPVGTEFAILLPIRHISEDLAYSCDQSDEASVSTLAISEKRSTILIVDDNDDFRTFMCASLNDEYNVLNAADGATALKVVEENDIDVVISDVMMPVVDGNELCRRMKSDINTSHIPIILLTAKMMKEDECCGLEAGADDYLTKPFNMSILRLRIAKFIEWKNRSKRIFEKELEITPAQITITTMDDRLLQQAINIINENIGNPEFSVAELSAALCMHRTSLYKKLVYITGKTPVEFIRSIRLKCAASLLVADRVYVSEIAYMVGFNSPKVFASHFKDEFGCSPTEYRRLNHKNLQDIKQD